MLRYLRSLFNHADRLWQGLNHPRYDNLALLIFFMGLDSIKVTLFDVVLVSIVFIVGESLSRSPRWCCSFRIAYR